MAETFIALACAHLIADFLFQPGWLIRRKSRPQFLLLHILIVTILTAAILGSLNPYILGAIAVTHAAADYVKTMKFKDTLAPFVIDQLFHFAVIAAVAVAFPAAFDAGAWRILSEDRAAAYIDALTVIAGFVAAVPSGAYLIEKFMTRLAGDRRDAAGGGADLEGLPNGGFVIGCLERGIIYILVVSGQAIGVGFLIAAKSLLRFGDIANSQHREIVEYIIIGTFASFGWSLLVATLIAQRV